MQPSENVNTIQLASRKTRRCESGLGTRETLRFPPTCPAREPVHQLQRGRGRAPEAHRNSFGVFNMVDDRLGHDKCPLCQLPAVSHFDTVLYRHGDRSANNHVKCDRCGEFDLTWGALERIDELGVDYLLSGITREWTETGKKDGKISEDNVNTLINLAPRTLKDRRRRLLKAISRKAAGFESEVMIDCNRDHPFAFVRAKNDFVFILGLLQAEEAVIGVSIKTTSSGLRSPPKAGIWLMKCPALRCPVKKHLWRCGSTTRSTRLTARESNQRSKVRDITLSASISRSTRKA